MVSSVWRTQSGGKLGWQWHRRLTLRLCGIPDWHSYHVILKADSNHMACQADSGTQGWQSFHLAPQSEVVFCRGRFQFCLAFKVFIPLQVPVTWWTADSSDSQRDEKLTKLVTLSGGPTNSTSDSPPCLIEWLVTDFTRGDSEKWAVRILMTYDVAERSLL